MHLIECSAGDEIIIRHANSGETSFVLVLPDGSAKVFQNRGYLASIAVHVPTNDPDQYECNYIGTKCVNSNRTTSPMDESNPDAIFEMLRG
jgi:hypothetical protein